MAVTQRLDPDARVLYVRVLGCLTAPDVRGFRGTAPESLDFTGILLDYSACDGINLQANELRTLAEEAVDWRASRRIGPIAMVAPQPFQFGMARMYQAFAELADPEREIAVFRDLDGARNWLGLSPDWNPPATRARRAWIRFRTHPADSGQDVTLSPGRPWPTARVAHLFPFQLPIPEPMSAQIISGKDISAAIRDELKTRVQELKEQHGTTPGLATVLVGASPASQMYVGMKNKAAAALGINSRQITLAEETTEAELLGVVAGLNADPEIHGILVQLPLPGHMDEAKVIEAISPAKDVDGFHPMSAGRLMTGSGEYFAPCTPAGVIEMLLRSGHDPAGKHVVVLGRSNIVGQPLANLLLQKARGGNATVTVCHSRTPDLGAVTRTADILVVAIGRPEMITADMVSPGTVVIDVGTHRVDAPDTEKGYRVCGDVLFDEVKEVAAAISPSPGGVGPMTITMLLSNTVDSAARSAVPA